jgi:DHA1 family bicyclomycin/chloramphenicol resistance-like MFS transporter
MGYILGNFLAGRFSRYAGVNQMIVIGSAALAVGMAVLVTLSLVGFDNPLAFFACISFVGLANGIALPNSMAGMVSVRPRLAGAASGLGGFLQLAGASALSVFGGYLVGAGFGPVGLATLMFACGIASLIAAFYVIRVAANLPPEPETP